MHGNGRTRCNDVKLVLLNISNIEFACKRSILLLLLYVTGVVTVEDDAFRSMPASNVSDLRALAYSTLINLCMFIHDDGT